MAGEQKPSSNLLEQFILLAKGTSGSALTALISQFLEAPWSVSGQLLELQEPTKKMCKVKDLVSNCH
uniref:COPS7B n=1 Tax=Cebus imitator TaxID=2715852 RepID=A0A2K5Q117_CEBIM